MFQELLGVAVGLAASDVFVLGTKVPLGEVWEWRVGHFRSVSSPAWEVAQSPRWLLESLCTWLPPDLGGETVAARQPWLTHHVAGTNDLGCGFRASAFEAACRMLSRAVGWLGKS